MNTSGRGSDGWIILMTVTLLAGVGMLLAGGPAELVTYVDKRLLQAFDVVTTWLHRVI